MTRSPAMLGENMEIRAPMKRGNDGSKQGKAMELPDGKTCGDCAHCRRCCMIFGHIHSDEVCDWYPSRFLPVTTKGETK